MKIAFVSAEVAPFSKTGGLADVSGSLPKALASLGHEVVVLTPAYKGIQKHPTLPDSNVPIHFIENESFFDRDGIYGDANGDYADSHLRFAYFCRASLAELKRINFKPEVIHCHDWHTALIPAYLKTIFLADPFFEQCKSIFTIHNLAYQGLFSSEQFQEVDLSKRFGMCETMEFWGKASYMKSALIYSDWVSTVSPGYCREIQTEAFGCGLQDVLKLKSDRLTGILNGIDTVEWDPKSDVSIVHPFDVDTIEDRLPNQKWLTEASGFHLTDDLPIIGMVTRLAEQKGFDLIKQGFEEMMKLPVRLVVLGTGDPGIESFFEQMNESHQGKFKAFIGFDAAKANRIYAGSDFFLMPSRFEPCGLGQMIAFRYGSLPIVHKTGGLADTVFDIELNPEYGNGFVFDAYEAGALISCVQRASEHWKKRAVMKNSVQKAMKLDFSWTRSAAEYEKLYQHVIEAPAIKVHENRSIVIGLTGLSGSGKSTVRQFFETRGALTVDSDALVHQALREKSIQVRISKSLNIPISDCEPQEFRQRIRKAIGADPKLLSKLEAIIHPIVRVHLTAMIQRIKLNGGILIAEIPLLFETGMNSFFDRCITVSRGQDDVLAEAKTRGWSSGESKVLIGRQWSEDEKCRKADYVIKNNGSIKNLEEATQQVYEQLKNGGINL